MCPPLLITRFLLPRMRCGQVSAVKDFVFDLHDAMRRSLMVEELDNLYTNTYKKLR